MEPLPMVDPMPMVDLMTMVCSMPIVDPTGFQFPFSLRFAHFTDKNPLMRKALPDS